jgi:hypothetical protein
VLRWVFEVWQAYAHRAGSYQTRVLLTGLYAVMLGPAGLLSRLFGERLLDLTPRSGSTSTWLVRPKPEATLGALRRQF